MAALEYDIILRPHHVKSFISFEKRGLYGLTFAEFLAEFRRKNKGYHDDAFVKSWKGLLDSLHTHPNGKFLYSDSFDTACEACDIKDKCVEKGSVLQELVARLDKESCAALQGRTGVRGR
jgi:hypothetical protein